jgi:hypothetical protein
MLYFLGSRMVKFRNFFALRAAHIAHFADIYILGSGMVKCRIFLRFAQPITHTAHIIFYVQEWCLHLYFFVQKW